VSDFEQSKRFFTEALSPLGYELIMEPSVSTAGFGRRGKPDFWIAQGDPGHAVHVAFTADDRATVDLDRPPGATVDPRPPAFDQRPPRVGPAER
jgi:catechol 2,3-dioxygenase-like lactoylglutathione lyase family enzyme